MVFTGTLESLDVSVGHRPAGHLAWSQADFEAVDVVPDVVGLVGVRRAEQRGVDGLGGVQVRHRNHQAADRGTHSSPQVRRSHRRPLLHRWGDGSTEQNVTAMDGLTVLSEEQRIHRRAVAYWLAGVAAGWPYIGWAAVSMSWVAAQEARRPRACSVEEPGSAA